MKIPAALCCISCEHPLYPSLARITSEGWLHVNCASVDTCTTCHAPTIAQGPWAKLTPSQRSTAVHDGYRRKAAAGICHRCYSREHKGAKGAARKAEDERIRAERLEDLHWMAEGGECLAGAATRMGLTEKALEKFLLRYGPDLFGILSRRNPRDHNKARDGRDITRAMPSAREDHKQALRTERRKAARESVAA